MIFKKITQVCKDFVPSLLGRAGVGSTFLFLLLASQVTYSQVGINTTNPNVSAALDIQALTAKGAVGLLIPRINTSTRTGLTTTNPNLADGLMVYDTDLAKFMYFSASTKTWLVLNGLNTNIVKTGAVQDTTSNITGKLVVSTQKTSTEAVVVNGKTQLNGDLNSTGTLAATKIKGEGAVPVGTIVMWSGSVTALPKGWALCDSSGGTPDLRGRFVVGYDPADTDYNRVQKTGPSFTDADGTSTGTNTQDAKQVRLLANQSGLPSHTHEVDLKTDESGLHSHNYTITDDNNNNDDDSNLPESGRGNGARNGDGFTKDSGNHVHTVQGNTNENLSFNAISTIENRPPYYVLAYIIKLSY